MNSTDYEIVISPQQNKIFPDLMELWRYRELFYILCWRDIKIRYKQTILGIVWVVIQPLLMTGVFSLLFGKIAKLPSEGLPYPLFVMSGLIFWNMFSSGLTSSSQSLLSYEGMMKKIYFPRVIVPLSAILVHTVDFILVSLFLITGFMINGHNPTIITVLFFILAYVMTFLSSAGLGLLLAALNIRFRDVRYVVPFITQLGLYLTPVIYPLSAIYDFRRNILSLNPMAGAISIVRYGFAPSSVSLDIQSLLVGVIVCLAVFSFGLIYFQKTERYFADLA